ncbi:MAG: hypothetical protein ACLGG0_03245 [Bacteriovoracia bacterium]
MYKFILALLFFLASSFSYAVCSGNLRFFEMGDPVDQSVWKLKTREFVPALTLSPVIFILPPIVGETALDRQLAMRFCNSGMTVYIVHITRPIPRARETEDFTVHDDAYLRAQAAIQFMMNWLNSETLTQRKFGILGMSLGGVLASYVAAMEPQIVASTIIAGAGNSAGLIAHSDQRIVVELRLRRMRALGISSVADYEAELRRVLRIDPLDVVASIAPGSMYMFIPNSDTTVPVRYQRQLRYAVREPLVYVMRGFHKSGLIKATYLHGGKITSFFRKRLLN